MALQRAGLELIAQGAAAYIGDIGRAEGATQQFVGSLDGAAGRASGVGGIIGGAATAIGATVAAGFAAAGAGAIAFAGTSVMAAGDFEAAVNNLAAISGGALAEAGYSFDDVSAKALQLGQDTRYSASESIAAMTELVKGGVPIAEVMGEATDATLNLAAASGTELASAAEIVSKQLGVWGDTGVEATQVADLLTQAANASTVGVEDLALGLANAGGTAKTAGVEFDDLVQTMALVAPNFSSASDAGTSLKTMLSRLIPTTDPAKTAMMDLGLYTAETGSAFYDATGSFIGMEAAAELLQNATAGLSEEQKLLALNTIFGQDAIRAAAAIAEGGGEAFAQMGVDMAAAGTAAEVAAIQNQGFNFAMDSLKGSVETLQITLGSSLLPVITAFINDTLIPGVGVLQTFTGAIFGNVDAFGQLSPQLQSVVTGAQGVLAAAQPVADFVGANLTPILITLAGVAGGLVVGALVAAAAPFAPLIGVIGAAIAIGAALYEAWQSDFAGVQGAVESAMGAVQDVVTSVVGVVVAFWDENGAEITASAQRWWGQAQEIIGTAVSAAATVVTNVLGAVAGFIDEHGDEIQSVLEFAWNSISNVVDLAMSTIQGIVTTVLGVVTGDWETAASGVEQIVSGLGTFIGEQFGNLVGLVEGVGPSLLSAAQNLGQSIIDGMVGAVSAGISSVVSAAQEMAQAALDAAMDVIQPGSPSKVFTALGLTAPAGLVRGMELGTTAVAGAAASMAGTMVTSALATVAGPVSSTSYGGATSYGDSYTFNIAPGASLSREAIRSEFDAALAARAGRADRLARQRGGFG